MEIECECKWKIECTESSDEEKTRDVGQKSEQKENRGRRLIP